MRGPEPHPLRRLPWDNLEPVQWKQGETGATDGLYFTEPTTIRTRTFDRVTYIIDERREKVATVWHQPHDNRLHSSQWVQVQFANETLYTGKWATLFQMFRAVGCELTGISRIDISADGLEGEGGDFPQVIERAWHGAAKYYGKCDWLARASRGRVIGGEFGTKASNKFIRAYRKKREMKRKGIKAHIVSKWTNALGYDPMTVSQEVNRFEVVLKGKEIRRYFPDEKGAHAAEFLLSMSDASNLVDVFASMAVDMFDFRTRAKRARDAQKITAWSWDRVTQWPPAIAFRATRNLAVTAYTIKSNLRAMFQVGLVTSDPSIHELALHVARSAGPSFVTWYQAKRIQWTKEFGRLARAGDPATLEYFHRLKDAENEPERLTEAEWQRRKAFEDIRPQFPVSDEEVNPW